MKKSGVRRGVLVYKGPDGGQNGNPGYTDDALAYNSLVDFDHESVKHSVGEYVRGNVHTNGIESFCWLYPSFPNGVST